MAPASLASGAVGPRKANLAARLAANAARPSTKSGPRAAASTSARNPGVSWLIPAAIASTARLPPRIEAWLNSARPRA